MDIELKSKDAPEEYTEAWLAEAIPGDRLFYHRGILASDRERNPVVSRVARRLLKAEELGLVSLVQQKAGLGTYRYIAIRTNAVQLGGRAA